MSDETYVKGLSDLQKFMDELPVKLEKNVMRGGLRAGMNVVLPVAKANIHSVSGELAEGLKISTSAHGGTVIASIKAKGKHGYVGRWLEYGTAAHFISGRIAKMLSFGGRFFKLVRHPGAKPHPFMRPALDSEANRAVVATAEYIKARLATKEGLDTSAVKIEGDE